MATKKIKNLSVALSKYTDHNGNEKTNWLNIGAIFQKDDGGKFMIINRTFNPAGVPNPDNKDSLIVGMFDVKEDDKPSGNNSGPEPENIDDIPF
jgi:hypothetical protein